MPIAENVQSTGWGCLLAMVAFLPLMLSLPAWGADTVILNNLAVTPGETAAQCYSDATEHLRKGMWFERAAIQLKEAIRQDPKNPDYHLALGCAYADRAASLGYASGFAAAYEHDAAEYPKTLATWEANQQDPKSKGYGSPRPAPPPAFVAFTKDDLETYALTDDQLVAQIADLSKSAQAEWKMAIALTANPKVRAYAEYVQGWGDCLLNKYSVVGKGMIESDSEISDKYRVSGIPTMDEAAKAFIAAIKDDPQAIYWQSLGDALGPPDTSKEPNAQVTNDPTQDGPFGQRSLAGYQRALSLSPKNALLWWYIGQFASRDNPAMAVEDLKQTIAADPRNAYPVYILASSEFKQTHYINNYLANEKVDKNDFAATANIDRAMEATITDQDRQMAQSAIALVEEGNEVPTCYDPVYYPPVPPMLAVAYNYLYRIQMRMPASWEQTDLAHDLCGYADVSALEGDLTGALDADGDVIAMGMRMLDDWSTEEDWKTGHFLIGQLIGVVVVNTGYDSMLRIAQHYGPPGMAEAVLAEKSEFDEQEDEWHNIERQVNPPGQMEYSSY